jgi:hypothetical protein
MIAALVLSSMEFERPDFCQKQAMEMPGSLRRLQMATSQHYQISDAQQDAEQSCG